MLLSFRVCSVPMLFMRKKDFVVLRHEMQRIAAATTAAVVEGAVVGVGGRSWGKNRETALCNALSAQGGCAHAATLEETNLQKCWWCTTTAPPDAAAAGGAAGGEGGGAPVGCIFSGQRPLSLVPF